MRYFSIAVLVLCTSAMSGCGSLGNDITPPKYALKKEYWKQYGYAK